jgi:hypothetical protein
MDKCYFYIANEIIKAMCVKCYEDHKQGWLWADGFGDNEIKCSICNTIINNGKIDENKTDCQS